MKSKLLILALLVGCFWVQAECPTACLELIEANNLANSQCLECGNNAQYAYLFKQVREVIGSRGGCIDWANGILDPAQCQICLNPNNTAEVIIPEPFTLIQQVIGDSIVPQQFGLHKCGQLVPGSTPNVTASLSMVKIAPCPGNCPINWCG